MNAVKLACEMLAMQMSEESIVCVVSSISSYSDADKENQCKDDLSNRWVANLIMHPHGEMYAA